MTDATYQFKEWFKKNKTFKINKKEHIIVNSIHTFRYIYSLKIKILVF